MKILIVGNMERGSNSRSLTDGFLKAGNEVRWVNTSRLNNPRKGSPTWIANRWLNKVTMLDNIILRNEIKKIDKEFKPDILVAIKTVMFDQSIMLESFARLKIHVSFDDVSNTENTTPQYMTNERNWDLIVTTKCHNVPELIKRNAKDVLQIMGAYDPSYHKNISEFDSRPYEIGFIGAARPDRIELPKLLAQAAPERSIVYGPRWERKYPKGWPNIAIEPAVVDEKYTIASNSIKIGLVLLNSDNRDTHTMRSYETPASGQLVLAQRTREHMDMFVSDVEALFFDSTDELSEKVRYLLGDERAMKRIARAGHHRITSGNNTYADRAAEIVSFLNCK